jgi:hypothetical protein
LLRKAAIQRVEKGKLLQQLVDAIQARVVLFHALFNQWTADK